MKRRRLGLIVLLVVAAVAAAPYVLWRTVAERELDVVVLDNTVPDRSYREHRGLFWLLNHGKYRSSRHGAYREDRDYYGFHPKADTQYEIRVLPDSIDADLIYLADAYGVYAKEWYGENPLGERSPRIYGGMQAAELTKVARAAARGTPLVVEFNTFASPTDRPTRERLYDLLRVKWSGWIGRYFNDLSKGVEVPTWALTAYESQYRRVWRFTGEGFVLVDEHDTIIVLLPGTDFSGGQCETVFKETSRARLGTETGLRYRYWFDVVRLGDGAQELAYFKLDLTKGGLERLGRFGVPPSFPAVVRYDSGTYWAYYFAGDFLDTESIPRYHQVYGYDRLKAWLTFDKPQLENQAFFWRVYAPMMRSILDAAYQRARRR